MVNKLILGDNLEILKGMEAETVDLIYLDPPP
jgi:site-specific DNA-methyltransferase (adenine-specific)